MAWNLNTAKDREWIEDPSDKWMIINWIGADVRLDVMAMNGPELQSFQGTDDAVRKAVLDWLEQERIDISLEHASYIGQELARAKILQENYIQS